MGVGDDPQVLVGLIRSPHGIRGEIAVEPLTDNPRRFEAGSRLRVRGGGSLPAALTVAAARPHRQHLLVRFEEVGDRTQAERLKGAELLVAPGDVPPPPAGSYYHFDLVGCRCEDQTAGRLGTVTDVLEDGGGVLLRVVEGGHELLVPFVDAYLEEVDVVGRRIGLTLPEGLIEACRVEVSE